MSEKCLRGRGGGFGSGVRLIRVCPTPTGIRGTSLSKAIGVVVEPAEALIPLTQNDVAATLAGAKALPVD